MEENKRATKGTEHTLQGNEKIGGEFKKKQMLLSLKSVQNYGINFMQPKKKK